MEKDIEYKVLHLIKEAGDGGILQRNLWKKIGASSREGSRISLRLERAGLIDRNRELHEGKWTYKLIAKKRPVSIGSMVDLPCTFCPIQGMCGLMNPVSPPTCEWMSTWVTKNSKLSSGV